MKAKREKEPKCEICGLVIDKDGLEMRKKKYYHSKCLNEIIQRERQDRRSAIKVIGTGTAIVAASFLGVDRMASAVDTFPRNGGGTSPRSFVLPQLFFDPVSPKPGEMWYRMDSGATVYHDGVKRRNIYSNGNNYFISVSSKGIINGLSTIPNDGADFGPDTTLGATSPGQVGSPYTTSYGLGEALQYYLNLLQTGTSIKEVRIIGGPIYITQPIVLNLTSGIGTFALRGAAGIGTYIWCQFDTTSSSHYPYAINFTPTSLQYINYINFQIDDIVPVAYSGNTPYGFLNLDFSTQQPSGGNNTFQGYNINIGNNGFGGYALHLMEFQQIYLYNYQNYGSNDWFDAINMELHGGHLGGWSFIGGASNGTYLSVSNSGRHLIPNGNVKKLVCIGEGVPVFGNGSDETFTVGDFVGIGLAGNVNYYAVWFGNSGGTIIINNFIIHDIQANGIPSNYPFVGQQSGGAHSVGYWYVRNVTSAGPYIWTSIPYTSPTITNPPVSGTVYQNSNTFDIEINLPVYATTSGTAGYVTIAKGPSSSSLTTIGNQYVGSDTSSTSTQIIRLRVPAGWYYLFSASSVSFGTASVFAD